MSFLSKFKRAYEDESGAVTVDWVVLAAAIVVLGSGVASVISPSIATGGQTIKSEIVSANPN